MKKVLVVKMRIFLLIVNIFILSGCGFHKPYKSNDININISGENWTELANKISNRLNISINPSMNLELLPEKRSLSYLAYNNDGSGAGYNLSYKLPVKIYDLNQNLLLEKTFNESTYLRKLESSQADDIQIESTFSSLINSVSLKLFRQIVYLNESNH